MKIRALLTLPAVLFCSLLYAQTPDYRFGKVSEDELTMSSYEKDADADAVILYEEAKLYFTISTVISKQYDYRARIKILKPEGTDQADVSIHYISKSDMKELVTSIDATAYNLEGGKMVKTPLKKQYVFTEKIDENNSLIKFSIPEVREGTVIEYRYRLTSPNVTFFPSFRFQHSIPVARSHMEAEIPEFFKVAINLKGHQSIDISETASTGSIANAHGGSANLTYSNRVIKADARDLPALRKEPFVWCLNDYRSILDFELTQIAFPGQLLQNFSASWESVNSTLAKSSFHTSCRIGNPFKDEVAAIKSKEATAVEKVRDVLKLVQSKMKWNGDYRLFSDRPRAAATAGSGTSAEINFVLMAALRDAGFEVVPILLNPRHNGRLPYTRATIDGIGTFVVRVDTGDQQYVYVDGTEPNSDVNILPAELLVDRARVYGIDGEQGWCDLLKLATGTQSINMTLTLNADGTVTGHIVEDYLKQGALNISDRYTGAQSEQEYIEDIEKEQNIQIENLKINGIGSSFVRQEYDMSYSPNLTDEYVYLNATILPFISKNPFTAQTRMLPVEFPDAQMYNIRCTLTVPQEYVVEEKPKNIAMLACEESQKCRYISQSSGPILQFNFMFSTSRLTYLATEYQDLNAFYGAVVDLNNSQIVVRRK